MGRKRSIQRLRCERGGKSKAYNIYIPSRNAMIHLGVISSLCLVYIEFGGFWESSKTNVMEGIFGIHWSMNMIGELDIFVSRMPPFARPHSLWANANLRLPLSDLFVSYEKKKTSYDRSVGSTSLSEKSRKPFFSSRFFYYVYLSEKKNVYRMYYEFFSKHQAYVSRER